MYDFSVRKGSSVRNIMLKFVFLRGYIRIRRKKMNIIEVNVVISDVRVVIIIARFNNFINDSLLEGVIDVLKRIG